MKIIIRLLRKIVDRYEIKHPGKVEPTMMCTSPDTRNRYKNDRYKIPEDEPQCPIYKDNRCCGGCRLAATCDHCVDCGCYGFTKGQMGGTDKGYYLHKASKFHGLGRVKCDGKFDWDYYYKSVKKKAKRDRRVKK